MKELLIPNISSAAFATAAVATVIFLLRNWILERLKNSIKNEYDRDIEKYKLTLARIHAATSDGQKAAIERRLKAFDRVWKTLLHVRSQTSSLNFHTDIRTVDEWKKLPSNRDFRTIFSELQREDIPPLMGDLSVEEERPYVGDLPWAYFTVYRSFNVRLVHMAKSSLDDPKKVDWYNDSATQAMLSNVLSSAELDQLSKLQIGKVGFVRDIIEKKFISAWGRIISGEVYGEEAITYADKLLKAAKKSETAS